MARIMLVMTLVVIAGLSLPRIVGISATRKIIWPTENTQSCHCIFKGYHFLEFSASLYKKGLDSVRNLVRKNMKFFLTIMKLCKLV
ncbi:hypothetical protein A3B52_03745 [Candidatus Curtissbacteria bacterium RIFCSPLOWO2_01_FULL_41_28]|uniref:Uncharacterized protein n=1 Tax=Candidatus Curtissbacteria bacterium RIFOXYA1_FULL_41_14 TaxID=1797737 RepID=A0A1F5HE91_9BACT|nr:MAG: hypothetical protein A2683_01925 [Candidatus Curtissbacteria bacterium RIFCSPHIGHO2_01_FULL_34_40]OGD92486.1 MAG: hypothetical protein A3E14_04170 [Candidatus Curtissbacteria bacterium RIFCSPHIGHO2_12_FULL_41_13]OGD95164.1 MAG: hypothetical protein A3B52_03745 [Candidatus Curtissbacteria bacterium RIFCSPLOWO2_01_FULL_41_28]OGE02477.1 MAG: hypothetical protein A2196_01455 [Candidatus Curtissbacteria bacterium RIFOXYA1_FULL_41_14]OGE04442.1 MAG: hypothetical protein A2362_02455 [Candidatu